MNHLMGSAMLPLVLTMSAAAQAADGATLYVSPIGNDAWSGTRSARAGTSNTGPFRTLERARDAIRERKKAGALPVGGFTVELQPGTYELTQTFELAAVDSGTPECPVTYRGAGQGDVRLVGGRIIPSFTKVTDAAVLGRLEPEARQHVLQADLKALGITDYGKQDWNQSRGMPGLELFFEDRPMTLARWPNDGFSPVADVAGPIEKNRRGYDVCRVGKFVYEGDRPARWAAEKDAWVHGYWYHDWADQRHAVAGIDAAKRIIEVKPPYHSYGYRKGKWFYGFNLLCELDAPGEWYLDREAGILYFWPPCAPVDVARGRPTISALDALVSMKNVSHVTIRGMTLEACRGTAVVMAGGSEAHVAGCLIRNTGAWAVRVERATRSGAIGCDITLTGLGGILLSGGDRRKLVRADLYAVNNHIHNYSRWKRMYQPGVSCRGVGNRVAHNLIHDAPHQAIGFAGNDHVFEFNEIHSVCHESNDAGAIYSGCNWSYRGTVVRHNYMHHVSGFRSRGCVGVYFDDILSGHSIIGNVFYKVTRAAFIGGGRHSIIDNNIFVDCKPALHIDARGMGSYNYGADTIQPKRLKEMPYRQSPWREHYPELVGMLEDEPHIPKYNRVTRNICVGGRWDEINGNALPHVTFEGNLLDRDPLFADADRLDFRLKPESPALELGFKPIPMEKIGLYNDEYRASWPVKHEVRPEQTRPLPKNPPTQHALRVAPEAIAIDGKTTGWTCAADPAITCATPACGTASAYVSQAWTAFDGEALYLLVINPFDPDTQLRSKGEWARVDAVEFALRDPVQSKSLCVANPIFNLRGFPDGRCESVCDAGATGPKADALGRAVQYAASVEADRWIAEWRIPLADAGMEPETVKALNFNLNIRRVADNSWMIWAPTGGPIWDVDYAGRIVLHDGK